MDKEIVISKTQPTITNNLPAQINEGHLCGLLYDLSIPVSQPILSITVTPEARVFADRNTEAIVGSLVLQSTYTIKSKHNEIQNYQLLHKCITDAISDFNTELSKLNLWYFKGSLTPPTFEEILPRLKELFSFPLNPN